MDEPWVARPGEAAAQGGRQRAFTRALARPLLLVQLPLFLPVAPQ